MIRDGHYNLVGVTIRTTITISTAGLVLEKPLIRALQLIIQNDATDRAPRATRRSTHGSKRDTGERRGSVVAY